MPQFIIEIDGLDVHFAHVRSRHRSGNFAGWEGPEPFAAEIGAPLRSLR